MTENSKLQLVTRSLGQSTKHQQATTQVVFDTLTGLTGEDAVFFQGANTRDLPNTNLRTNKLPYNNNMVVSAISINGFGDTSEFSRNNAYFTLEIGNEVILKDVPLCILQNDVKTPVTSDTNTLVFVPKTSVVIPANTSFKVTVRNYTYAGASAEMRCVIKGFGTIAQIKN